MAKAKQVKSGRFSVTVSFNLELHNIDGVDHAKDMALTELESILSNGHDDKLKVKLKRLGNVKRLDLCDLCRKPQSLLFRIPKYIGMRNGITLTCCHSCSIEYKPRK